MTIHELVWGYVVKELRGRGMSENRRAPMVLRYEVPQSHETFSLDLPLGAKPIKFQVECGETFLYALGDVGKELQRRYFRVVGTSQPVEWGSDAVQELVGEPRYIDSCQFWGESGGINIHLFEFERMLH